MKNIIVLDVWSQQLWEGVLPWVATLWSRQQNSKLLVKRCQVHC